MLLIYKGILSPNQNNKIEVGDIVVITKERFNSGDYTLYKEGTICRVKKITNYGSLAYNLVAVDIGTFGTFHDYEGGICNWYETKNGKEREELGWWYEKNMFELVEKN